MSKQRVNKTSITAGGWFSGPASSTTHRDSLHAAAIATNTVAKQPLPAVNCLNSNYKTLL